MKIKNLQPKAYNLKPNLGFTLLETTIAMGIFAVVISVTIGAFILSIQTQRVVLAEKAVSENINFALEFMSRQIRVARRDGEGTCISLDDTLEVSGSQISFINGANDCVRFFLSDNTIKYENITTSSGIIPLIDASVVTIVGLSFFVQGQTSIDSEQPRATIVLRASGAGQSLEAQGVTFNIQTTVSTRALDI